MGRISGPKTDSNSGMKRQFPNQPKKPMPIRPSPAIPGGQTLKPMPIRSNPNQPVQNSNIDTREPMPSYKKGGTVKKTGPALVHKGEKVIPKEKAKKMEGNMRMSSGGFMKC